MRAGEASNASATFDGTLVITAPSGKQLEVKTTFDTGSDTDAVSVKMATKLIELGCSWGDAGGGIVMADGRETTLSTTLNMTTPGGAFWVLPALLGDMTALPHDTRPQIASR